MKNLRFMAVVSLLCFPLFLPPVVKAQGIKPGVRIGAYTDVGDLFLGGELLIPVASRVYFNPNVEYVFIENGNYITFNGDVHYDVYLENSNLFVWFGGGLAIIYFDPEGRRDADSDVGANLLFGAGLTTSSRLIPYIQGKVILSDNSEFALGFGLRF